MHCFFEYFKSSLSSVMSSISSQKYRKYRRVSISYFVEGPFFRLDIVKRPILDIICLSLMDSSCYMSRLLLWHTLPMHAPGKILDIFLGKLAR